VTARHELPALPERYEPTRLLGEGSTGDVYHARDRALEEEVAVKVVRANLAMHAKFRARFAREVALSAQFVHPRVIPTYDEGRLADGRPYVALAFADAGSLVPIVERADVREGLRLVDQVLEALGAIHARGLLHQDLKPQNVLLHTDEAGRVAAWVADLGVAGALSEFALDRKGMSGTPLWMAPEQLEVRPAELGPWTDLYAVGLVLRALLGGRSANPTIARPKLIELRSRPPRPIKGIPKALDDVIATLLDPDPRQRYDRAADARKALAEAHRDWNPEPVPLAPTISEAPAYEAPNPRRRGPVWNRAVPGPLPAWRTPPPAPIRSLSLYAFQEPSLIGRDAILRELWDRARHVALRREAQVVLLCGPTGSGKSRIAAAIATALDEGGFMERVTLRYHDPPGPEDGYRGAVRELLVPWSDDRDAMEERLVRWLARERPLSPAQARAEAALLCRWCGLLRQGETAVNAAVGLAYLYRHLDAHAWRGGACLVLDDAHHASAQGDGLDICSALLDRTVGERPVLALGTLDDATVDRDPELRGRIDALVERGAHLVRVDPLPLPQLRALLLDALSLTPDLAAVLSTECHGSPLHASLLVRDWASRAMLRRMPDRRFGLQPGVRFLEVLPRDLGDLAQRRIEGALARAEDPTSAREAFLAAALAGPDAPVQVVRAINPEGLDALIATGLVAQDGWRLRFEHEVIAQEARRKALAHPKALGLHARLADAWRDLGERTGSDVSLALGMHRLAAGQANKALEPLLDAASTMLAEGRTTLALSAGELAVEAADRIRLHDARIDARRHVAEVLLELERTEAASAILDEIEALGHIDRRSTAILRILRARVATARGELELAKKLLHEAALTLEAMRDVEGLTDALHGQAIVLRLAGRPREAIERYERMAKLNEGNALVESRALDGLLEARLALGEVEGAEQALERLRLLAQQTGDTRSIAHATYTRGLFQLQANQLADAERSFRTAQALAATLGADALALACHNNLGELFRQRGDASAAEECYRSVVRFARERNWEAHAAVAHLNLSSLLIEQGRRREARDEVGQAEQLLESSPQHWAWLHVGLHRAVWSAEDGDEARCRQWWELATERGLGRVHVPELRPMLTQLAALAGNRGWDDVERRARSLVR
jgi:serine/threonine protein kinase/tetratricopeptide (TPR) repeat protein